jgi:hypothetical protein
MALTRWLEEETLDALRICSLNIRASYKAAFFFRGLTLNLYLPQNRANYRPTNHHVRFNSRTGLTSLGLTMRKVSNESEQVKVHALRMMEIQPNIQLETPFCPLLRS